MIDAAVQDVGDVSVGRVLSRSFELLSGSFVKFVILTAIVWAPSLVYQLFFFPPSSGIGTGGAATLAALGKVGLGRTLVNLLLPLTLSVISQAALLYGAFQQMRGRPFDVGSSLQKGLGRFFPVLGAAICLGLGVGFGTLLLIVPGIILWTMWYVAIPACVLEGIGPFEALSRSSFLTSGSRWKVLGLALVIVLIIAVPGAILQSVLGFTLGWSGLVIGAYVGRVLGGALAAIVAAVLYHELRVAKEGVDVDRIAAVFD